MFFFIIIFLIDEYFHSAILCEVRQVFVLLLVKHWLLKIITKLRSTRSNKDRLLITYILENKKLQV